MEAFLVRVQNTNPVLNLGKILIMHYTKCGRNQAANDLVIVSTSGKGQTAAILAAFLVRPKKKISVFLVTGLKILGKVGTHIFFN